MKHRHIYITPLTTVLLLVFFALSSCSSGDAEDKAAPTKESLILSSIKKKADLVTTEVSIRRLAIYDSSKYEKVDLVDPRTWKYGDDSCLAAP